MMVIHYHKQTGRIGAWGNADSERSHLADHEIVRIDAEVLINPQRQRIEAGEIVDIDEAELATWNCPTVDEIAACIEAELRNTDQFMMPDRNVDREPWIVYRQTLRDLSKLAGPIEMINAWPTAPDGRDPIIFYK
jgi:hypothetical protein